MRSTNLDCAWPMQRFPESSVRSFIHPCLMPSIVRFEEVPHEAVHHQGNSTMWRAGGKWSLVHRSEPDSPQLFRRD